MLTVNRELARLMDFLKPASLSRDLSLTQHERRQAWIVEQRLSPSEAEYIPVDFDPAYPYPREDRA